MNEDQILAALGSGSISRERRVALTHHLASVRAQVPEVSEERMFQPHSAGYGYTSPETDWMLTMEASEHTAIGDAEDYFEEDRSARVRYEKSNDDDDGDGDTTIASLKTASVYRFTIEDSDDGNHPAAWGLFALDEWLPGVTEGDVLNHGLSESDGHTYFFVEVEMDDDRAKGIYDADKRVGMSRVGGRKTAGRFLLVSDDVVVAEGNSVEDLVLEAYDMGYTEGYVTNQNGGKSDLADLLARYASRTAKPPQIKNKAPRAGGTWDEAEGEDGENYDKGEQMRNDNGRFAALSQEQIDGVSAGGTCPWCEKGTLKENVVEIGGPPVKYLMCDYCWTSYDGAGHMQTYASVNADPDAMDAQVDDFTSTAVPFNDGEWTTDGAPLTGEASRRTAADSDHHVILRVRNEGISLEQVQAYMYSPWKASQVEDGTIFISGHDNGGGFGMQAQRDRLFSGLIGTEIWLTTDPAYQSEMTSPNAHEYIHSSLKTASRPLYEIADDIRKDWGPNVNFGAKPYLEAMFGLSSMSDMFYSDSAGTVVSYFLSNSRSWSGDKAKEIKAELRAMQKRGSKTAAEEHQCATCGRPAAYYAYQEGTMASGYFVCDDHLSDFSDGRVVVPAEFDSTFASKTAADGFTCKGCGNDFSSMEEFPGGICVDCYAASEDGQRMPTAQDVVEMWGGTYTGSRHQAKHYEVYYQCRNCGSSEQRPGRMKDAPINIYCPCGAGRHPVYETLEEDMTASRRQADQGAGPDENSQSGHAVSTLPVGIEPEDAPENLDQFWLDNDSKTSANVMDNPKYKAFEEWNEKARGSDGSDSMEALREHQEKEARRRTAAATCSCARNGDGTVTAMLCPEHADMDPCFTMAQVTGDRRKGSIVNGVCSNCGWSANKTARRRTAAYDVMMGQMGPGSGIVSTRAGTGSGWLTTHYSDQADLESYLSGKARDLDMTGVYETPELDAQYSDVLLFKFPDQNPPELYIWGGSLESSQTYAEWQRTGSRRTAAPSDGQTSVCRLCGVQMQGMDYAWYALKASPVLRPVGPHGCVPARIEGRPGEFGPDGVLVPGTPGGEGGQYDAPAGTIYDAGAQAIKVARRKTASSCADCGSSIEQDPEGESNRGWHHNDGSSHDHEAKPGKESSRRTAGVAEGDRVEIISDDEDGYWVGQTGRVLYADDEDVTIWVSDRGMDWSGRPSEVKKVGSRTAMNDDYGYDDGSDMDYGDVPEEDEEDLDVTSSRQASSYYRTARRLHGSNPDDDTYFCRLATTDPLCAACDRPTDGANDLCDECTHHDNVDDLGMEQPYSSDDAGWDGWVDDEDAMNLDAAPNLTAASSRRRAYYEDDGGQKPAGANPQVPTEGLDPDPMYDPDEIEGTAGEVRPRTVTNPNNTTAALSHSLFD